MAKYGKKGNSGSSKGSNWNPGARLFLDLVMGKIIPRTIIIVWEHRRIKAEDKEVVDSLPHLELDRFFYLTLFYPIFIWFFNFLVSIILMFMFNKIDANLSQKTHLSIIQSISHILQSIVADILLECLWFFWIFLWIRWY